MACLTVTRVRALPRTPRQPHQRTLQLCTRSFFHTGRPHVGHSDLEMPGPSSVPATQSLRARGAPFPRCQRAWRGGAMPVACGRSPAERVAATGAEGVGALVEVVAACRGRKRLSRRALGKGEELHRGRAAPLTTASSAAPSPGWRGALPWRSERPLPRARSAARAQGAGIEPAAGRLGSGSWINPRSRAAMLISYLNARS
jgi:hypothetical protein